MTGGGFDEACSGEQLGRIGDETLGEAAGSVEKRSRTAWVDVILFCNALCDRAGCDDRHSVVSSADIDQTYETGDGCFSPTTTIDALGEFVDEIIDATH